MGEVCLSEQEFTSVADARGTVEQCRWGVNLVQPQRSLGYRSSACSPAG